MSQIFLIAMKLPLKTFLKTFSIFVFILLSKSTFSFAQNSPLPFEQFIKLFPTETKPLPFAVGKVWLNRQVKQPALDKATIKKYITNCKIWATNLLKTTMPESENLYPVAKINLHNNFYTLLVANSQEESSDVYLLTYTKDGRYVDGVCVIVARPAAEGYSRSTILDGGKVLMVKESKQGKPQLFTFDIWDIGTLHGKL
jgi:hypothetical protein